MNKQVIDLRSDTVTLPSREMLSAIQNIELGDDVFEEDPTVNRLQEKAARIMGKEAGILVPSGTMGNLASILTHCARGDEIILGDQSHTFLYEVGGISAFGGIHSRQLTNNADGTINLSDIENSIRKENIHFPPTSLICLESTHNRCFGAPLSVEYINQVSTIAKNNNCRLHLDGARIFNAAVALDIDIRDLVNDVDSVTFCLSKGLSSPVGSVICGDNDFIKRVRHIRKALGGGMRQAGIIAGFGEIALDNTIEQIKKDHDTAFQLSQGLANIEGIKINLDQVYSNIIYFRLEKKLSNQLVETMEGKGILFFEVSPNRYRLVTHYGINSNDIEKVLTIFNEII